MAPRVRVWRIGGGPRGPSFGSRKMSAWRLSYSRGEWKGVQVADCSWSAKKKVPCSFVGFLQKYKDGVKRANDWLKLVWGKVPLMQASQGTRRIRGAKASWTVQNCGSRLSSKWIDLCLDTGFGSMAITWEGLWVQNHCECVPSQECRIGWSSLALLPDSQLLFQKLFHDSNVYL